MRATTRTSRGTFARKHYLWTGDDWDDGSINGKGRMWVYRPDYPRADRQGRAQRAHVVWWLAHGEVHPAGMVLHHVNEDKLDDRLENLQMMDEREHVSHHKAIPYIDLTCEECGETFRRPRYKPRRFCSQRCYHAHPKSEVTRQRVSESLKVAYAKGRR